MRAATTTLVRVTAAVHVVYATIVIAMALQMANASMSPLPYDRDWGELQGPLIGESVALLAVGLGILVALWGWLRSRWSNGWLFPLDIGAPIIGAGYALLWIAQAIDDSIARTLMLVGLLLAFVSPGLALAAPALVSRDIREH